MVKKNITEYNFNREVVDLVIHFAPVVQDDDLEKIKQLLGEFTLEILDKLKNDKITPQLADKAYLLLDLYINDNLPDLDKDKNVYSILFEGNILHDLGKPYGADLKLMENLAKKLLKSKQNI